MAKRGRPGRTRRSPPRQAKSLLDCSVEVDTAADDGRGIARIGGKVAFVAGALPGERVTARSVNERRRFIDMETVAVERASEDRIEPLCPHYGVCGGCSLQHWRHEVQIAHKEAVLRRQLGLNDGDSRWQPPLISSGWGYRWRARLVVGRDRRGVVVGFRRGHSHHPADIAVCPVLHPELERLLAPLHEVLDDLGAAGLPREVELALYDEEDTRRAVTLWHFTRPVPTALEQAVVQWAGRHDVDAWLADRGEVKPLSLAGRGDYTLRIDDSGLRIGVRPADFSQVNVGLNRALVARVVDWLDPQPDARLADLFCGVGNFSLPLARRAAAVTGVEQVAVMVERLRSNAAAAGLSNIEPVCADLAAGLSGLVGKNFDAVLLDPPRRGAPAVAGQLGQLGARRVAYVSCDPATLGRDAELITAQGYTVKAACMADMFAQTSHTEAVVLFER